MAEISFLKPCRNIQVGDKEQLLKTHFTVMKSLPEMERLKEGLCSLGLMDAMKKKFLNQCSLLLKLFLQQVGSLMKIYFNSLVRVR